MYPAEFDYVRVETLDQAVSLLAQHGGDAKLLAGGHSLIPMLKLRLAMAETVIDIGRLAELRGIESAGGTIRIGSLTTHHEVATSDAIRDHAPLLAQAASKIADPAVRNKGTVGGNLAHADPASDLPAVFLALDATIQLRGPDGSRDVAARDFFTGLLETAKSDDELLVGVTVPGLGSADGSSYQKVEHPASGYAICGAAAVIRGRQVSLAYNGIADHAFVARTTSEALSTSDLSDDAISSALDGLTVDDPMQDIQASGEYRLHLAKVHGKRAVRAARDARTS
ncbi:MAG: xanthine dehydrogenase family protein subunit M [Thermoanaerobaculia bacterium]|nr:xanthine dehydrogenase family protein subunit M [Thermoanaerobaculia bacterium]